MCRNSIFAQKLINNVKNMYFWWFLSFFENSKFASRLEIQTRVLICAKNAWTGTKRHGIEMHARTKISCLIGTKKMIFPGSRFVPRHDRTPYDFCKNTVLRTVIFRGQNSLKSKNLEVLLPEFTIKQLKMYYKNRTVWNVPCKIVPCFSFLYPFWR